MVETLLKAILEGGNAIAVVSVVLVGSGAFVWALTTERLFLGGPVKELKASSKVQTVALEKARDELRAVELDYARLEAAQGEVQQEWEPTPIRRRQPRHKRTRLGSNP